MFNKIFQKFIIIVVLLFPLVHHAAFASEIFSVESTHSETEELLGLLLHEDNKDFLNNLIVSTYEKDKSKSELKEKMCTHSDAIVQAWKGFIKKAPSPLSQDQWNDTVGRKEIYVFTDSNYLTLLEVRIMNPIRLSYNINNKGNSAIYADYAMDTIVGVKYTDTTILKGKRKKATPDNLCKKEDLNHIRVIINVDLLIKEMKKRQQLGGKGQAILPEISSKLADIASICPQG